jgi:hypothetical protein
MLKTRNPSLTFSQDAQRHARLNRRELHTNMFERICEVLTTGVDVTVLAGVHEWSTFTGDATDQERLSRAARLKRLAAESNADGARLTRRAGALDDDAVAELLLSDARKAFAERDRLQAELESLSAPQAIDAVEQGHFDVPVDALVTALTVLASPDSATVDRESAMALRSIVQELTFTVVGERVLWALTLLLPATDGRTLAIGPVTGSVPNRPSRRPTSRDRGSMLPGFGGVQAQQLAGVALELRETGLPRALADIASHHPLETFPAHMLAELAGEEAPGWDRAFAAHIRAVYSDAASAWTRQRVQSDSGFWQVFIDALSDGPLTMQDLIGADRYAKSALLRAVGELPCRIEGQLTVLDITPREGYWHGPRILSLKSCPHCGRTLDLVLRLPEVPGGVICSTCRRSPLSLLVFPVEYLAVRAPAPPGLRSRPDAEPVREIEYDDEHGRWRYYAQDAGLRLRRSDALNKMLTQPELDADEGLTSAGMSVVLGVTPDHCKTLLREGHQLGLLERFGHKPARFRRRRQPRDESLKESRAPNHPPARPTAEASTGVGSASTRRELCRPRGRDEAE